MRRAHILKRLSFKRLSAVGLIGVLVATGCTKNTGAGTNASRPRAVMAGVISTDPAESRGPARPVEGATPGGTVYVMPTGGKGYEHLDPARNYVSIQQIVGKLIYRTLTSYRTDASGKTRLVGDLATDPGKDLTNDCKTWQYTLKKGVKYEDGTAVTAKDVAYGIARSFTPAYSNGPKYLQRWLMNDPEYSAQYRGPYDGGAQTPPNLEVKDDSTLIFKFAEPHCDLPHAASMTTTAPVPAKQDTKLDYDKRPFASGPYKIEGKYVPNSKLELVRNPHWDPASDPIRHNYPERFSHVFGLDYGTQSRRILADKGVDQSAVSWSNMPPDVNLEARRSRGAVDRIVDGPTQYTWVMNINNQRIQDVDTRRAINYALNKRGILNAVGGDTAGELATTLMSPTTAGYSKYDAYPAAGSGDADQARKLLAGKPKTKLVYAYRDTEAMKATVATVKESLERVGFEVVPTPVNGDSYYTDIGKRDNPYDIYISGWGADWPSGLTVLPPLYDGRTIQPSGNDNYSYFADDAVSSDMDRISKLPSDVAAREWGRLDEELMRDHAPAVPIWYDRNYTLVGSKVGNPELSTSHGRVSLDRIYVKR